MHAAYVFNDVTQDGGWSKVPSSHAVKHSCFSTAFDAKLQQLTLIVTCFSIWHPQSLAALKETGTVARHDLSRKLTYRIQDELKKLGVAIEVEYAQDGSFELSGHHFQEINDDLRHLRTLR